MMRDRSGDSPLARPTALPDARPLRAAQPPMLAVKSDRLQSLTQPYLDLALHQILFKFGNRVFAVMHYRSNQGSVSGPGRKCVVQVLGLARATRGDDGDTDGFTY